MLALLKPIEGLAYLELVLKSNNVSFFWYAIMIAVLWERARILDESYRISVEQYNLCTSCNRVDSEALPSSVASVNRVVSALRDVN